MGWGTAIGEALRVFTGWWLDPKRKAKKAEDEKQQALQKAKELAHGEDEKALEKHINQLPG